MRKKISCAVKLLLNICLVLILLSCCEKERPADVSAVSDGQISIRVLTESGFWSESNKPTAAKMINRVLAYYQVEYPNITIEVETLPNPGENREAMLQQRRVALMAGDVPDIYLFPTLSYLRTNLSETRAKGFESLFRDVAQAQTNGWFADISEYYDRDDELQTEELHQVVMNAGVVGDARYILPLGYTFETLVADGQRWEALDSAIKDEISSSGNVLGALLKTGSPEWIPELYWHHFPLNDMPELCDYVEETTLLDKEYFVSCLKQLNHLYQAYKEHSNTSSSPEYLAWLGYIRDSHNMASPFSADAWISHIGLEDTVDMIATAKCTGENLKIMPLKAPNGELTADITYWGAVSSSSKHKEAAYDILRIFLSHEVQHGEDLVDSKGGHYSMALMDSLMPGWPVRYKGFVKSYWAQNCAYITTLGGVVEERARELLELEMDDNDLPILEEEIAYARFPSALDQRMYALLEPLRTGIVPDEELDKIAETFLRDLKYHLAEG